MNKKHWNTIFLDGTIPDNEILKWIDQSYYLVLGKKHLRTNKKLWNILL
jgi:predicted DNA-binding protein (MmcQ/YjbR family)